MNRIYAFDRMLQRLEGWLIIAFVWMMAVFTFLQVALRGLYTHAHLQWANALLGHLDWTEPLVRLLVLWLTFLGASLLTSDNNHIKIDLFSALLSKKWLPFRDLALSIACVLICGIMVKDCFSYVSMEKAFGGSMFLEIPVWIGQIILPIGFLLILFRFLLRGARRWTEIRERKRT